MKMIDCGVYREGFCDCGKPLLNHPELLVKLRKRGTKAFWFLSGNTTTNRLRIHAVRFRNKPKAERIVAEIEKLNPEYEAKITF